MCYGKRRMRAWLAASIVLVAFVVSGCSSAYRWITGTGPAGDPSINLKSAETRWLLVKNPRFGDVASEPEYIWVEEDKVPFSFTGMLGKRFVIASPDVVTQYGPPPGGGKLSAQQRVPYSASPQASTPATDPVSVATSMTTADAQKVEGPKRGYVVWVDTTRIAIDLTARDGVKPGAVVSLRRDRIPIVHPITGEVLGDLDDEVATARVTELKDKFSVAEIQTLAPGSHVQVKDRVVVK